MKIKADVCEVKSVMYFQLTKQNVFVPTLTNYVTIFIYILV